MSRILVIDDDREFLQELGESLSLSDYEVVEVSDPALAFEEAARVKPDLILLDLKMPHESGFQLACRLKYFSEFRQIPIIAMTAWPNGHVTDIVPRYGFRDCIVKPIDPLELVLKIERAL